MITDVSNPYEGIESLADGRFAIFANRWPPFRHHSLIGVYHTLDHAIQARNEAINNGVITQQAIPEYRSCGVDVNHG